MKSSAKPVRLKPSVNSTAGSIRLQRVSAGENTSATTPSASMIITPPIRGVPDFLLWETKP